MVEDPALYPLSEALCFDAKASRLVAAALATAEKRGRVAGIREAYGYVRDFDDRMNIMRRAEEVEKA